MCDENCECCPIANDCVVGVEQLDRLFDDIEPPSWGGYDDEDSDEAKRARNQWEQGELGEPLKAPLSLPCPDGGSVTNCFTCPKADDCLPF